VFAFCTVITRSHLPFALALGESLFVHDRSISYFVLISDSDDVSDLSDLSSGNEYTRILSLQDLNDSDDLLQLKQTYERNSDAFRWSLKPILLIDLIENFGCEKIFYADSDIYFFNSYQFLWEQLGDSPVLLSPHWRPMHPAKDEAEFLRLFKHGLFNAGFIGVTSSGIELMRSWVSLCIYNCNQYKDDYVFDDQSYLNLFLLKNPDCRILQHRGCNVAVWNRNECTRSPQPDGSVLINNQEPIIFVHFSNIAAMIKEDSCLIPYVRKYSDSLIRNGLNRNVYEEATRLIERKSLPKPHFFMRLFRKLPLHFRL
jgi:hypothetical protein